MSPSIRILSIVHPRKAKGFLFTASLGLLVALVAFVNASTAVASETPGYYPSEAYQESLDSVLQNPTEREFEYLLDAMLESPVSRARWGDYVEYTILALRDHYTQRMDGFIDSNFINPPPPVPPTPPAPGTPEPPVVWPSEAYQEIVNRLFQNPTDQEFGYALDQVIGSPRTEDYVEYIVLGLRVPYTDRVNDFVRYLWTATPEGPRS